jgi:erythronate-4-phosphate dehydrogenase
MVNENFLNMMKDGAILVNTSRGKVVDEEHLCALAGKKLNGMIIDVWENEPAINGEFVRLADIATPHIAGHSYDGKIQGTGMIYDAACAFYFKDKLWDMDKVIKKHRGGTIDISKSKNHVYDIVENAYPIIRDDKNLRKILEIKENKKADYFNELRKNYPRRLEFAHFSLERSKLDKKSREIIESLGFVLNDSMQ